MNNDLNDYKTIAQKQWQTMNWASRCTVIFICALLLIIGLVTGFFIFCLSMMIAIILHIKLATKRQTYTIN